MIAISVILPTYGRDEEVVSCLTDLLRQTEPALEVLVVDQSPQFGTVKAAYRAGGVPRVHWLTQAQPNLPAARNNGLRAARGDVVLFLDDDVALGDAYLSAHATNYAEPTVLAVAGPVWSEPRQINPVWPRAARDPVKGYFAANWQYDRRVDVRHGPGGNFSVRREAALAVGGFDEAYEGNGFREETDFFIRLGRLGGRMVYDPDAGLIHRAVRTAGCWSSPPLPHLRQRYRNHCRLIVKNFARRHWPRLFLRAMVGMAIRGWHHADVVPVMRRVVLFLDAWHHALRTAPRLAFVE